MNGARVLRAFLVLAALVCLTYAFLPYNATSAQVVVPTTSGVDTAGFLVRQTAHSCGPAAIDAWRSKSGAHPVFPAGVAINADNPAAFLNAFTNGCRGVGEHRLRVAGVFGFVALVFAFAAWYRRGDGLAHDPSPLPE